MTRPEATQAQVRPRAISRRGISREALSERDSRRARPSATFRACGVARGAQISVHAKRPFGRLEPPFCFRSRALHRCAPVSRFLPTTPRTTERLTAATDRRVFAFASACLAPPASRARLTQAAEPNARAQWESPRRIPTPRMTRRSSRWTRTTSRCSRRTASARTATPSRAWRWTCETSARKSTTYAGSRRATPVWPSPRLGI